MTRRCTGVIRGLAITTKPNVRITSGRAELMLSDYAGPRIVRHPMQPLQARVFELRDNFTAYDAMYVALAERLALPLLTDDARLAGAPGHHAQIQHYRADLRLAVPGRHRQPEQNAGTSS